MTFSRAISSAVMRNSQLPNVYTLSYSVNITVKYVQEEVIIEDEVLGRNSVKRDYKGQKR